MQLCSKHFFKTSNVYLLFLHSPEQKKNENVVCSVMECSKTFSSIKLARRHFARMHKQKYKCNVCPEELLTAQQLKSHQVLHCGYPCPECGFVSVSLGARRMHRYRGCKARKEKPQK